MALGSDAHCDNETLTPPRLSGGGAGCEFGGGDRQNCGFGFARSFDGGMKKFREGFDAGDEAGAGPGEMAAGFEGVDTLIADGGNRLPRVGEYHGAVFVARLLGAVAARRDEKNLRGGVDHIFDRDAAGWRALFAEDIFP